MTARVQAGRGGPALSLWLWFGALTVLTPISPVRADPVPWEQVCSAAGNLAGLLAIFRNQGKSAPDAMQAAAPRFSSGPSVIGDRAIAAEIARQVYDTPALTSEQESASIEAKCLTPPPVHATAVPTKGTGPRNVVSALVPIPLQRGINRIARFGPDGSDADILLTWHDGGPGRGHDAFFVAGVNGPDGVITDDPNHGDDMIRSVRFARGKVDGEDAVLLLRAERRLDATAISVPTETTFEVYRVIQHRVGSGISTQFALIERLQLQSLFCNADMALSAASGLPLRESYRGPRRADGQFTANGCPVAVATR